jgi:hypothetical protein
MLRHVSTRVCGAAIIGGISGLGVLIVAFAPYALTGVPVFRRHRLERDAALAGNGAPAEAHHRNPRLSLVSRGTRGEPIGVCDE